MRDLRAVTKAHETNKVEVISKLSGQELCELILASSVEVKVWPNSRALTIMKNLKPKLIWTSRWCLWILLWCNPKKREILPLNWKKICRRYETYRRSLKNMRQLLNETTLQFRTLKSIKNFRKSLLILWHLLNNALKSWCQSKVMRKFLILRLCLIRCSLFRGKLAMSRKFLKP